MKKVMDLAGNVRDLDIAVELLGKSRMAEAAVLRGEFGRRRKIGRAHV